MLGSFESMRWVCGGGGGGEEGGRGPMLTPRRKAPLPEATALHHAGQRAQRTTD